MTHNDSAMTQIGMPTLGSRTAIRVLILSENRLFRDGLMRLLTEHESFVVIGSHSGSGDLTEASRLGFHVALVDVARPPGLRMVAAVRAFEDRIPVVAVGLPLIEQVVVACAESGVSGYVLADGSLDDVVTAIEHAARGDVFCPPQIASTLARRFAALATVRQDVVDTRLTRREQEILRLIDEGLSNKQIGSALQIQVATVKNHVHNIIAKLGVSNRAAAAAAVRSRPMIPAQREPVSTR